MKYGAAYVGTVRGLDINKYALAYLLDMKRMNVKLEKVGQSASNLEVITKVLYGR